LASSTWKPVLLHWPLLPNSPREAGEEGLGFAYTCLGAFRQLRSGFLNWEARFASLASLAQLPSESWPREARACVQWVGPPGRLRLGFLNPEAWFASLAALAQLLSESWPSEAQLANGLVCTISYVSAYRLRRINDACAATTERRMRGSPPRACRVRRINDACRVANSLAAPLLVSAARCPPGRRAIQAYSTQWRGPGHHAEPPGSCRPQGPLSQSTCPR